LRWIDAQPLVENPRDVKAVRAFRDDHGMKVDITLNQSSVNIEGAKRAVKEVFTGSQGVPGPPSPVSDQKRQAMPQHPAGNQRIRDLGAPRAGVDDEQQVPGISAIRRKEIEN
jgi:hypothetical protein